MDCAGQRCQLDVNGELFGFDQVFDVSLSGTGIALPLPLDPGTPVQLLFQSEEETVQVRGTIAWCKRSGEAQNPLIPPQFRGGIRFDAADSGNSRKLYRALNRYFSNVDA
jgi:hypothetical protein